MPFTPEELAEMAKSDEEIERDFRMTSEERRRSNRLDSDGRLDALIGTDRHRSAAAQKEYREANREKIAAAKKEYYEANREKYNAYMRAYMARKRANAKNKNPAASEDTAGYLKCGLSN